MSRSKKRSFDENEISQENVQTHYTSEQLSEIIAAAILAAEKSKREQAERERKEQLEKWRKLIHAPKNDAHGWKGLWEDLKCLFRIAKLSFTQRAVPEGTLQIERFLIMILQLTFELFVAALTILAVLIFCTPFWQTVTNGMKPVFWINYFSYAILGILIFFLARVIKIISDELNELKDTTSILGLFSCVISFLSFAVAVAAFMKG